MINRETFKYEESRKWNNLTGNYAVFQVVSKLFGERRSFKRERCYTTLNVTMTLLVHAQHVQGRIIQQTQST